MSARVDPLEQTQIGVDILNAVPLLGVELYSPDSGIVPVSEPFGLSYTDWGGNDPTFTLREGDWAGVLTLYDLIYGNWNI